MAPRDGLEPPTQRLTEVLVSAISSDVTRHSAGDKSLSILKVFSQGASLDDVRRHHQTQQLVVPVLPCAVLLVWGKRRHVSRGTMPRIALTDRFIKSRKPAPNGARSEYRDALVPGLSLRVTDKVIRVSCWWRIIR